MTDRQIQVSGIAFILVMLAVTLFSVFRPMPWSPVGQFQQQQQSEQNSQFGDLFDRARDLGYAPKNCQSCRGV